MSLGQRILVSGAMLVLAACGASERLQAGAPEADAVTAVTGLPATVADPAPATTDLPPAAAPPAPSTSVPGDISPDTPEVASGGADPGEPVLPLPPPLQAQIDGLAATVESLRQLEFLDPPVVVALTPQEVVERRAESLREDLAQSDLGPETALYRLLGVFEQPVDLEAFYTDFYSSSTLAFYDLERHELVIPLTGEILSPYEQWIVVHELTHALLDQRFPEITARYMALVDADRSDRAGALLGLIEGEAVLVQSLFYETLDSTERSQLQRQADERRNETFAAAPSFFRAMTRFPYTDGSLFTLHLYQRGGMQAVDRAYASPPTTTEEIYDPAGYVAGIEPVALDLRLDPPHGFDVVDHGTWGARGWRTLLGQFLNGGTAAEAARGWGADEYALLWNAETGQIAFVVLFAGDTTRDAAEFGGGLEALVESAMDVDVRIEGTRTVRFTGADYAEIARIEGRTLFVAASDAATGTTVRAAVAGFGS